MSLSDRPRKEGYPETHACILRHSLKMRNGFNESVLHQQPRPSLFFLLKSLSDLYWPGHWDKMLAFNVSANHRCIQFCECHSCHFLQYMSNPIHMTCICLSCWEVEGVAAVLLQVLQLGKTTATIQDSMTTFVS